MQENHPEILLLELLPYLLSLAITLGLAVFTFHRRSVLGARAFSIVIFVEMLETVGFILELVDPSLNGKMFWDNFQWFTTFLFPVASLYFIMVYIGRFRPAILRWLGLLAVISLGLGMVISADLFPGSGIISPQLIAAEPFSVYTYEFGPVILIASIYSYILLLSGFFVLGREGFRQKGIYRLQTLIILVGLLVPVSGTVLVLSGIDLLPNRDILPFTFAISNIFIVVGLFRYKIFDILPIARNSVMDHISDPVAVLDTDDTILDVNPAFEELLKLPGKMLLKKPIRQFLPSLHPLDESVQKGIVQEECVVQWGQETGFFDTSSKPLNNRLGVYGGRLLIFHNITGLRRAEEELRKHRDNLENLVEQRTAELVIANKTLQAEVTERLRLGESLQTEMTNLDAVFESSPVAMLVLDETTNIVMANRAAVTLTGGSVSDVLQHRPGNALRCIHSHTDPRGCGYSKACSICPARNGMEALLANGGSLQGAELPLVLIRNGEPQDVWLEMGAENMLINGHRHLCVAMNDVTARKRAEEALRENELKYRALFETAEDAILLFTDDRWVDCNAGALSIFDCTREQIIGAHPIKFSPPMQPDGRSSEEEAIKKINLAFTVGPQAFEWEHCRLDGTPFAAEVSLNRLDLGGKPHMQAIVRDISKRKAGEKALRQKLEELHASNNELEQFNRASVGRELRMIELKEEINELCRRLGEAPRHATDQLQTDSVPGAGSAPAPPGGGGHR